MRGGRGRGAAAREERCAQAAAGGRCRVEAVRACRWRWV